MTIDLTTVWAFIIAFAVFVYVVMDGFDLGLGILFPLFPAKDDRDLITNTVAPVWDGNETWLVLGGGGLMAAFPLAYAVLMPALYTPMIAMLIGLIFRGVAFEFRFKHPTLRRLWDSAFCGGSLVATFAQGIVLGTFIDGFNVDGRQFAGTSFDWFAPFPLAIGLALVFGYGLLGATWLVFKTEGELQDWARRAAAICLIAVLVAIAGVSIWTPLAHPDIARRWFSWPNIALLSPVPIVTALIAFGEWEALRRRHELTPFLGAIALFLMSFVGIAISLWPMIVPYRYTLWQAASSASTQAFLLIGTLFLLPIILMYTAWSYWVFRGKARATAGYH